MDNLVRGKIRRKECGATRGTSSALHAFEDILTGEAFHCLSEAPPGWVPSADNDLFHDNLSGISDALHVTYGDHLFFASDEPGIRPLY